MKNRMLTTVKNQEKLKLKTNIKSKNLPNYQTFLNFLVNNTFENRLISGRDVFNP